jgi:hypothetical protein
MTKTTCEKAGAPKACPKKTTTLILIPCHKAANALLGPFLIKPVAEFSRIAIRNTGVQVSACRVESVDELTNWYSVKNGHEIRALARADHKSAR